MKISKFLMLVTLAASLTSLASAQDHGDTGLYGEYFRFQGLKTDMAGVGGRLSLNLFTKKVQTEAELGFLFNRGLSNNISAGNSNIRVLHGLFGPKLNVLGGRYGRFRPFVTAKGGFFNTEINGGRPTAAFATQVRNIRQNNISPVFYPGGGIDVALGERFSLRADVGDEMVINNGVNHNLRVTFGPRLRF